MQLTLRRAWMTGAAALTGLTLAACVPAAPQPTPAPAPAPVRAPVPAPQPPSAQAPAPAFSTWMDAPRTPGDWRYQAGTAQFVQPAGGALVTLRCDQGARVVEIARTGQVATQVPMVIRAETMERSLAAVPYPGASPMIVARLAANDRLLDAMAFSKGHFAIEVSGLPALYVPSFPEVTRVIEDCR